MYIVENANKLLVDVVRFCCLNYYFQPGAASAKQTRKKDEDVDNSPLLVANNAKYQRTLDESKLKVLKWNFTAPREEFVELLKDQMTNANVNRGLIANMFHSDFR